MICPIDFCGVHFPNPFLLSAAPPTDDLDMVRAAFEAGWGGAVLKTTSVETEPVDLVYPMMSAVHYEGRRIMGLGNIDLISEHHIDVVEQRVSDAQARVSRPRRRRQHHGLQEGRVAGARAAAGGCRR